VTKRRVKTEGYKVDDEKRTKLQEPQPSICAIRTGARISESLPNSIRQKREAVGDGGHRKHWTCRRLNRERGSNVENKRACRALGPRGPHRPGTSTTQLASRTINGMKDRPGRCQKSPRKDAARDPPGARRSRVKTVAPANDQKTSLP